MNFLSVAETIRDELASVSGVKVAAIGINAAWPTTPALEVIPVGFDLRTFAAGNLDQLVNGTIYVAVYVAVTRNLEEDEETLLPIVQGVIEALNAPTFDRTLGGEVEDLRPTSVEFDVVKREGRNYRSALIEVAVGDVTQDV